MSSPSRRFAGAGLLLLTLVLAGCATAPRVVTEIDPEARFSSYRTFAFYSPLALESDGYASYVSERARAAVQREMGARGYAYDEGSPDLWININSYLQERTDVRSAPSVGYAPYYGYRGGYFVSPFWYDRTRVTTYTEGTLNIDVVDVQRNRLVWEGVAVGRVGRSSSLEERAARVDQSIAQIFVQYPFRAGSPGPVL